MENKFPVGWDEERVRKVLEHYEQQTEDEVAYEHAGTVMVEVPRALLPEVRALIARHRKA